MIIMPVPKDIRTVQAKFIGPLTKRQTKSVAVAVAVAVAIYQVCRSFIPAEMLGIVIGIFDIPILLCGFIDVYGMPLWIFAKDVAVGKLVAPKRRPYVTENSYHGYAKQNIITYEYFDGDLAEYTAKEQKKKKRLNKRRLDTFLKKNPKLNSLK